jgi:hypothetical protein
MGLRRERPSVTRSGEGITLRLPDGTVKTMNVKDSREPVPGDLCCFCGERVEQASPGRIRLSARWIDGEEERTQSWGAHHDCLSERMHAAVTGAGPFFGS